MRTRRFRLCCLRSTSAGTATDDLGLILHAATAEAALANARALGMFAGLRLVAVEDVS